MGLGHRSGARFSDSDILLRIFPFHSVALFICSFGELL